MKLIIDKKFLKDASKLSYEMQKKVTQIIDAIKVTNDMSSFGVTKMAGYRNHYRIRIGDYRIGYQVSYLKMEC